MTHGAKLRVSGSSSQWVDQCVSEQVGEQVGGLTKPRCGHFYLGCNGPEYVEQQQQSTKLF
eukprot:5906794-Lingulodinium_polyedra.AAC.1